jgi:hypothetical protein
MMVSQSSLQGVELRCNSINNMKIDGGNVVTAKEEFKLPPIHQNRLYQIFPPNFDEKILRRPSSAVSDTMSFVESEKNFKLPHS